MTIIPDRWHVLALHKEDFGWWLNVMEYEGDVWKWDVFHDGAADFIGQGTAPNMEAAMQAAETFLREYRDGMHRDCE